MAMLKQCSYHGCTKILSDDKKYCEYHQRIVDKQNKERYKEYYNRTKEDESRKAHESFYSSKAWIILSDIVKKHFLGECVICNARGIKSSDNLVSHHIETLDERDDLKLDEDNIVCVCARCHQKIHKEYNKGDKSKAKMKKILYELIDMFNNKYYGK